MNCPTCHGPVGPTGSYDPDDHRSSYTARIVELEGEVDRLTTRLNYWGDRWRNAQRKLDRLGLSGAIDDA